MKYFICGIEITEEHANRIKNTIHDIEQRQRIQNEREEAAWFIRNFGIVRNNPHATFKGNVQQYIIKYLPGKLYLLKYM